LAPQIDAQTGGVEMTKQFLVIFENGEKGFGAQAPDIPGCFAIGKTLEETRARYLEAAAAHLAWLASDHDRIPEPATKVADLSEEARNAEGSSFHTEWLSIPMPAETRHAISA
jgi:predicted RNase H-like HicB family nuclease